MFAVENVPASVPAMVNVPDPTVATVTRIDVVSLSAARLMVGMGAVAPEGSVIPVRPVLLRKIKSFAAKLWPEAVTVITGGVVVVWTKLVIAKDELVSLVFGYE